MAKHFAAGDSIYVSSPLYRSLCRTVAGDRSVLELLAERRPGQQPSFLLFGAVHYLLLGGAAHPLGGYYPSLHGAAAADPSGAGPALLDFCRAYRDELAGLIRTRLVQPRTITDAQVEEVVVRTLEEVPEGSAHWSKRELARRVGISPTSVHRIWRAFGLQPWRTETFKISPDPLLTGKIRDVVSLYMAPPANAAVFSVDEKPQIQALERSAPVRPMIPGVPERRSFDYVRHGTIDLFAALNIATGKVTGKLSAQHRAIDFRDFLDQIDHQTDPGLDVHVICDNLSTHKAPVVQRWLLAHPRFVLHFTPTYSSWINQVERWLAELQRRCLERGVFCSLDELTTALEDWIKLWNEHARPFKWTKTSDQIIDRICRYCSRISGPAH